MQTKLKLINNYIKRNYNDMRKGCYYPNHRSAKIIRLKRLNNENEIITTSNNFPTSKNNEKFSKAYITTPSKIEWWLKPSSGDEKECIKFDDKNFSSPEVSHQKCKIIENNKETPSDSKEIEKDEKRVNEINMQMLSRSLYEQIFKYSNQNSIPPDKITSIRNNLQNYNINIDDALHMPDVNINLPKLEGKDIEEHFYNIAKSQVTPYLNIIKEILNEIPPMPEIWQLREGWTRYTIDGAEKVDYPLEDGLVFDVEVCMKHGQTPTLATAVSTKAWYGWVSKSLIKNVDDDTFGNQIYTTDMLIPLESTDNGTENGKKLNAFQKKPKIIVGHNVSYDRSKIKEQYWLNNTGTRFVDTMSLHVSVSGVNSYQRAILSSKKTEVEHEEWQTNASLNNLVEVHKLYCKGSVDFVDKTSREIFVEGTLRDVKEKFNELMTYCAKDVIATHEVLQNLFPMFEERFPHPVTLAGMLEIGTAYLPVNSNWQKYLEEVNSTFEDLNHEAKVTLANRANTVCNLIHDEKYKEDLWMWDQDWSTQKIRTKEKLTKKQWEKIKQEKINEKREPTDFEKYLTDGEDEVDPLKEKFAYLEDTKHLLYVKQPHMPGYPAWYRKLCMKESAEDWAPGPQDISTSMQVVAKLLNLTWENYPLHYIREHGWGILVPYNDDLEIQTNLPLKALLAHCPVKIVKSTENDDFEYSLTTLSKEVEFDIGRTEFWRHKKKKTDDTNTSYKGSALWCNVDIDNCCYFFKLPHKDGAKNNVGNPLAKDFLNKFSENVLAGSDASAKEVLKIAQMVSYWRNNKDRIMSQFVVWLEKDSLPSGVKPNKRITRYGAIIPHVVVSGTLTRRAVEPTWMTASNSRVDRVGSELRSMVQAPPGYSIVGADVDSQELWIASVIGDSHYSKLHGATPFGWMTLIGNKSNGTDMHSVTAKAVGISRDHAKVINYARIYGAGQKFAERLLKQFNPSMTDSEASSKSKKMMAFTKGKKIFRLKPEFINEDIEDKPYNMSQLYKLAKMHGKPIDDMYEKYEWIDGSESAMFNRLEEIANSENPATPFLNSRLSRALESRSKDSEKYLPTKINWVVQSGAVDFLHLMLVSMRWLMRDNARFCLSFHDEVRYLVPSRFKYNAALAMHVTNLLTRSFCSSRLGIKDLPMSVAFFAAVEVDSVLRKESSHDCKTPSNPHGLQAGYDIPLGESLNVWEALEKSGGSLGYWHKSQKKSKDTRDKNIA